MAWIGPVIGAVGGLLSSSGGGGSSTSSDSGPWAATQPLLANLALQTATLQPQYAAMPFNQQQLAAINNQFGLSDYARSLVPQLLGQMQSQPLGFDRNNPTARPQAYNWGLAGDNPLNSRGLLSAQNDQAAIDAQDQQETQDLLAGKRATTRFFPLGATYGPIKYPGLGG